MSDPLALAEFPGISVIKSAEMTLSHGVTPSACTITTIPHSRFISDVGTLKLTFGDVKIEFPEAAIAHASLRIGNGFIWTLRILDRRWKWKFGHISGKYNERDGAGRIRRATEKTPQDLARLLLQEMGENGVDVGKMPNQSRPPVEWDYSNPAQELATLCEQVGCRIILGLDNKVKIRKIGDGDPLPLNDVDMNASFAIEAKVKPTTIMAISTPIRVQSKLKLEAVGLDTDGQVKVIDDLSYKPAGGWSASGGDPFHFGAITGTYVDSDGKQQQIRNLAFQSVYRWYRVKEQANGGLVVPGIGQVKKIEQIFPLFNELNDSARNRDGDVKRKEAFVEGVYWPKDDNFTANLATGVNRSGILPYRFAFLEDGVIEFESYVTKLDGNKRPQAPELYLTCTYNVRKNDGGLTRFTARKNLGGKGKTKPQIIRNEDIEYTITQRYRNVTQPAARETSQAEFARAAQHYLDAAEAEYTTEPATDVQYAGIVKIEPDGAIQQVSWSIPDGAAAVTRASRNAEHSRAVIPFKEMRRRERAEAAANALAILGGGPLLLPRLGP